MSLCWSFWCYFPITHTQTQRDFHETSKQTHTRHAHMHANQLRWGGFHLCAHTDVDDTTAQCFSTFPHQPCAHNLRITQRVASRSENTPQNNTRRHQQHQHTKTDAWCADRRRLCGNGGTATTVWRRRWTCGLLLCCEELCCVVHSVSSATQTLLLPRGKRPRTGSIESRRATDETASHRETRCCAATTRRVVVAVLRQDDDVVERICEQMLGTRTFGVRRLCVERVLDVFGCCAQRGDVATLHSHLALICSVVVCCAHVAWVGGMWVVWWNLHTYACQHTTGQSFVQYEYTSVWLAIIKV